MRAENTQSLEETDRLLDVTMDTVQFLGQIVSYLSIAIQKIFLQVGV
jgi:hypothetical protein